MTLPVTQAEIDWVLDSTRPERLSNPREWVPGTFSGIGTGIGRAIESVPVRAGLLAHEAVGGLVDAFGTNGAYNWWLEKGEPLRELDELTTLQPWEASPVGQGANAITKLMTDIYVGRKVAGPYAGSLYAPIQFGGETRRKLLKEGVPAQASMGVAALDAANIGIGIATTLTQSSIWGRVATGAVANLLTDIPITAMQRSILKEAGEAGAKEAEKYDPLSYERMILNAALGGASGIPKGIPLGLQDLEFGRKSYETRQKTLFPSWYQKAADEIQSEPGYANTLEEIRRAGPRNGAYNDPAYDRYAQELERYYGLPPAILEAIKNAGERSGTTAVSPVGAKGVMQFMPATARQYDLIAGGADHRTDPWRSMDAGASFVDDLLRLYSKKSGLAIDDPKVVRAAIAHYNGGGKAASEVLAGRAPPAQETVDYLARVEQYMAARAAGGTTQAPPASTSAAEVAVAGDAHASAAKAADQPELPKFEEILAKIPENPRLALHKSGAVDIEKSDSELIKAFVPGGGQPNAEQATVLKRAVMARAYGGEAVDLFGARNKGADSVLRNYLANGMLEAAADARPIAKDVVAAARAALSRTGAKPTTAEGALQANLGARLAQAKSAQEVAGIIRSAAKGVGKDGSKARAAADVAREYDAVKMLGPADDGPKGKPVERPRDAVTERAERLAAEGRYALDEDGNRVPIARLLDDADTAIEDAATIARVIETMGTVC